MKNRNVIILFTTLALLTAGLAFPQRARATDLDGVLPGGNNAVGVNALTSLTTGTYNTAVGLFSLKTLSEGNFNTAIGAGTLFANTANENTATGAGALLGNSTGNANTANGAFALFSNTTGRDNVASGTGALMSNDNGNFNTANGNAALFKNRSGDDNAALGNSALFNNTEGDDNTAVGFQALAANTTADFNTPVGFQALFSNTTGQRNTAIGQRALRSNTTGSFNIALGPFAGEDQTTGSGNIYIGNVVGFAGESNNCYIGSIFTRTSENGTPVFVNQFGKLGTTTFSKRFKEGVKPMNQTSEALYALEPVTFRYKKEIDPSGTSQFGLVAEDVEKVNPQLVVRDKEGKPYSVRYDQVNAMLLNEFLKEHKKVEEQAREIREQKAAINRLGKTVKTALARIEEHELKTRRVNEQNEVNQVATRRIRRAGPMLHIVTND